MIDQRGGVVAIDDTARGPLGGLGHPPRGVHPGIVDAVTDLVDELRARFGGSVLRSRRIEVADAEDEIEMMFTRGWTDGLPVVPPTEERVARLRAMAAQRT